MAPPHLKLWYWPIPGRAETSRLMLLHAGLQFEDAFVTRDTWKDMKPQMPFGQVPVLEVDGKKLAQSSAIERYVAKLGGLYPTDPFEAAKVDEIIGFVMEIAELFAPTWTMTDVEAKKKLRQEVVAGPLKVKLEKLSSVLEAAGGEWFANGKISYADFYTYAQLSLLVSGFMDGVPNDLLNGLPPLKAFHNRMASLPAVAKFYDNVTEGVRLAYKRLP